MSKAGWVTGEDGKVYAVQDPEMLESARAGAKEEADECGQLYDAVFDNDFEKVKEILCWEDKSQEKIEFRKWYVNEKSWHKWRPLHAAAQAGYTDMAKFLVECGAEIDALTNVNNTALQLATAGGHTEILKMLIGVGANVMISTEAGLNGTALHYAAGKGHLECVRILTDLPNHEALVNELSADNCTALYYAVTVGNLEVSKLLLEKGGKKTINEADYNGQTALHMSALTGKVELAKLLVEFGGADKNVQDINGRTPAIFAKEMCQMAVMNYLNSL